MEASEVYAILGDRTSIRGVDDENRERLKVAYMDAVGATTMPRCTPCFWRDLMHHFRYQLKQAGYYAMKTSKYIIANNATLRLHGQPQILTNGGEETKNTTPLTDEIAEELLKRDPKGYKDLIIKNPDYKAPAPVPAPKAAATPAAKPAAPKVTEPKSVTPKTEEPKA